MENLYLLDKRVERKDFDLVPFFWKVLREAASDSEKAVLKAVEQEFKGVYLDLSTRYKALEIQSAPEHMQALCRIVFLRELPREISDRWERLSTAQQKFFEDRNFVLPGYGNRYKCVTGIHDVESLSILPDGNGHKWENEKHFASNAGTTWLNTHPFDDSDFEVYSTEEEIRTPWSRTYTFRQLLLFGNNMRMSESPLDTHYAGLLMDEPMDGLFTERSLYRTFIYNFYKVMYRGATIPALQGFVNSMAGAPYIINEREKVVRFTIEFDGTNFLRRVHTDKNHYDIPFNVPIGAWVTLGAELEKYTPVGEYIRINNYVQDPEWAHGAAFEVLAGLTDKVTGVRSPVVYDLNTTYGFDELEHVSDMQKPRFDLAYQTVGSSGRLCTASHGLWHRGVGPVFVQFGFVEGAVSERIGELFRIILKEVMPIHIIYETVVATSLMDSVGQALLDHEENVLEGTTLV